MYEREFRGNSKYVRTFAAQLTGSHPTTSMSSRETSFASWPRTRLARRRAAFTDRGNLDAFYAARRMTSVWLWLRNS